MTGPDHYREAERLGRMAEGQELAWAMFTMAQAQVHATLALAAATAMNDAEGGMPTKDWDEWRTTVSADQTVIPAGGES